MRHRSKKISLGRENGPRDSLMKNLAESLVLEESVRTTVAKARALRRFVEPLITRAKKNTLANRRLLLSALHTEAAVKKLLDVVGPRYATRPGGYTRTIKLAPRRNDGADMARIELVQ